MKRIIMNKKQKAEMKRIANFFMEAVEPIEDKEIKARVSVKILSRLGCFADRLTAHLTKKQGYEEV